MGFKKGLQKIEKGTFRKKQCILLKNKKRSRGQSREKQRKAEKKQRKAETKQRKSREKAGATAETIFGPKPTYHNIFINLIFNITDY